MLIEGLLARHREPHRRYHTATHVMWVCRHVGELLARHPVDDAGALLAAALFHDAVYDPASSANELHSADLAARDLADVGWTDERCATVRRLVLCTAHHAAAADDEAVLVDADLAILGAQAHEYLPYATAVRSEYAHLDDDTWRRGRAQVIERFLAQPHIYATSTMRDAREARARANLAAELSVLQPDR
ncbi:MAG: phosphohydrolase [Actinobacteria bacterium]|nr:phosphohydrolase [Actinomycetota bacterium]